MYTLSYANRYNFYKMVNNNMIFRLAVGGRVLKLNPNSPATFDAYEQLVDHRGKPIHVIFMTLGDWPYSLVFNDKTCADKCKGYLRQELEEQ